MQTPLAAIPDYLVPLIDQLRARLGDPDFVAWHRRCTSDFTRQRSLTFPAVLLLLPQKTGQSVQRHRREFLAAWLAEPGVTAVMAGAWTQARAKFKHTAFVELNQDVLLPLAYAPAQAAQRRTWQGHRLLGVDGSALRLPATAALLRVFGTKTVTNQGGATGTCYPEARISVLYDLLNELGLDARLEPGAVGEVDLARQQAVQLQPDDLRLWDRGFTGFVLMAAVRHRGAHFLGRCSRASFLPAEELFQRNRAGRSLVTERFAPEDQRAELKRRGLPTRLRVRFVSVRLPTGELEVLVTSLLDEATYPTDDFLELYHCRWGHETYYEYACKRKGCREMAFEVIINSAENHSYLHYLQHNRKLADGDFLVLDAGPSCQSWAGDDLTLSVRFHQRYLIGDLRTRFSGRGSIECCQPGPGQAVSGDAKVPPSPSPARCPLP